MESPLVRGGITLMAGVLAGNILGFGRVAVTAYLLGTHSRADSLAVAMGPMDTLNSVLINGIVFAFVPMLTSRDEPDRAALFLKLNRCFGWALTALAGAIVFAAPWLMRALAPGLDPLVFGAAVLNLRVFALAVVPSGMAAAHFAYLYTSRRFGPTAFYQASLNLFMIAGALALWRAAGVSAFAIGYAVGAWVQLAVVWFAARGWGGAGLSLPVLRDCEAERDRLHEHAHTGRLKPAPPAQCEIGWLELLAKPGFYIVYAAGLGLNMIFTRAWATHTGPGMAAALDYCQRGVQVPLALLVAPISNSLLPEIARLRAALRIRQAFRLIDRTMGLTALASVSFCAIALLLRKPAIAILFQRGSFTAESTRLVAAAFVGLAPCLIGWSLMEIGSRSQFALDRRWPPVIAACIPVLLNVAITFRIHSSRPELIGLGATVGALAGFAVLFVLTHAGRKQLAQ